MAKVTFNGPAKLIIVDLGITEIDVKVDLYSDWKEWAIVGDNSKYPIALSAIGGDPIGGGRFLGSTFFLENGWKIRPYEGDHTLVVTGNLYARDGSSPFVNTVGDFNVLINSTTSNIVDTIATGGAAGAPTASQIADAIWDRTAIANADAGSFGQFINLIKAATDATAIDVVELKTKVDDATALITTLIKYEANRTKIDQTAKTLTVFDDDGVTPFRVFDLRNFAGQASITEVAERAPQ
jgi:hypothetical protein